MMGAAETVRPAVATLDPTERLLRSCRGESVDRPPVWLMRQAGRYLPEYRKVREGMGFLEMCQDVERAADQPRFEDRRAVRYIQPHNLLRSEYKVAHRRVQKRHRFAVSAVPEEDTICHANLSGLREL